MYRTDTLHSTKPFLAEIYHINARKLKEQPKCNCVCAPCRLQNTYEKLWNFCLTAFDLKHPIAN